MIGKKAGWRCEGLLSEGCMSVQKDCEEESGNQQDAALLFLSAKAGGSKRCCVVRHQGSHHDHGQLVKLTSQCA